MLASAQNPMISAVVVALILHACLFALLHFMPNPQARIVDHSTFRVSVYSKAETEVESLEPATRPDIPKPVKSKKPPIESPNKTVKEKAKPKATQKQEVAVKDVVKSKKTLAPSIVKTEITPDPVAVEKPEPSTPVDSKPVVEPVDKTLASTPIEDKPKESEKKSEPKSEPVEKVADQPVEEPIRVPAFKIGSPTNPTPNYPGRAKTRGWEGDVILGVHVEADGSVSYVEILESSNVSILDFAAYSTVKNHWSFSPADEAEAHLKGYVTVPISFQLN